MAFIESPRFPDAVAHGAVGGPVFSTDVVELDSGYESRNQRWSAPRARWSIGLAPLDETDRDDVIAFIRAVAKGKLNGFRFKDFNDYAATISQGVLTATGINTYQLYKRYTTGGNSVDRAITKPVSGAITIQNGLGQTLVSGVDYSLATTTGIVTVLGSPTPVPTAWSGQFDVPVRLDSDEPRLRALDGSYTGGLITQWESIELLELRV